MFLIVLFPLFEIFDEVLYATKRLKEDTFNPFFVLLMLLMLFLWNGCNDSIDQVDPAAARFLERAQKASDRGAFRVALTLVDSAEQHAPRLADVYYLRGRILYKHQRYQEAQEAFQEALSLNPSFQSAWQYIGNSAFRQRKYHEALNAYQKESITSAGLFYNIGRAYASLGKADSAFQAYQQALRIDSTYVDAHIWLSQLYRKNGKFAKALTHARYVMRRYPKNAEYKYEVGLLLFRLGRVEEAASYLEAVLKRRPTHEGALYNLGQALIRLGYHDKAQYYLARLDSLKQVRKKIYRLQREAQEDAKDPMGWLRLGEALERAGHLNAAIDAYERALSLVPQNVALQNNIANLYLAQQDTVKAIRRYRAILQQNPTAADVWLNLGVVYANSGRFEAAQYAWRKALEYDPDHAIAKAYLRKLSSMQ